MPIITSTTGNENQKNSSAKVSAFIIDPRTINPATGKGQESPLFLAHKRPHFIEQVQIVGQTTTTPARNRVHSHIGGSWKTNRHNVEDGLIIRVTASRKMLNNSKTVIFAVRVRSGAAMRVLTLNLAGGLAADSTLEEIVTISGRFDRLTLDDLTNDMQIAVAPQFQRMYSDMLVNSIITETIDEPQISPPPTFSRTETTVNTSIDNVVNRRSTRYRDIFEGTIQDTVQDNNTTNDADNSVTESTDNSNTWTHNSCSGFIIAPEITETTPPAEPPKKRTVIRRVRKRSLDV